MKEQEFMEILLDIGVNSQHMIQILNSPFLKFFSLTPLKRTPQGFKNFVQDLQETAETFQDFADAIEDMTTDKEFVDYLEARAKRSNKVFFN